MANKMDVEDEDTVVLPGDDVSSHIDTTAKYKLGPGLKQVGDRVVATASGALIHNPLASSHFYFVRQSLERYNPRPQDRVVGVIKDRMGSDPATGGDLYRVHLTGPHTATLSNLQFEGASKRNKPQFTAGQIIYCRVDRVFDCLDPQLSCILGPQDDGLPRRDWMTSEGLYGELRGGTLTKISTGLARQLLLPDNVVLSELSRKKLVFEIAVGVNGLLWIHSERPEYTVVILNAIQNSAVLTTRQIISMVDSLVDTVEKEIQASMEAA